MRVNLSFKLIQPISDDGFCSLNVEISLNNPKTQITHEFSDLVQLFEAVKFVLLLVCKFTSNRNLCPQSKPQKRIGNSPSEHGPLRCWIFSIAEIVLLTVHAYFNIFDEVVFCDYESIVLLFQFCGIMVKFWIEASQFFLVKMWFSWRLNNNFIYHICRLTIYTKIIIIKVIHIFKYTYMYLYRMIWEFVLIISVVVGAVTAGYCVLTGDTHYSGTFLASEVLFRWKFKFVTMGSDNP